MTRQTRRRSTLSARPVVASATGAYARFIRSRAAHRSPESLQFGLDRLAKEGATPRNCPIAAALAAAQEIQAGDGEGAAFAWALELQARR